MVNLHIKFEVSVFSHYKDVKDKAKCKKMGWFGVNVTQVTGNVTIR